VYTLDRWCPRSPDDRRRLLAALAAELGPAWRPGRTAIGRHGLGELVHDGLGVGFAVIPGGWLRMGLSADDLMALAAARGAPDQALSEQAIAQARPTRWVRVRPFLLAVTGSTLDLAPDGLRLPSEAELEWAFREGGTVRWIGDGFGLDDLDVPSLCADGWCEDHAGAGHDATARQPGGRHRVARGRGGVDGLVGAHAAGRTIASARPARVRLAADLPGDVQIGAPGELAEDAATLAALAGDDRARAAALTALAHLARGPGRDVAPTARKVIRLLPAAAPQTRAALLRWLADAQVGGHVAEAAEPPPRLRADRLPADRGAVRDAVAIAADPIAAHLVDADPDVRAGAALALGFCPGATTAPLRDRLAVEPVVGVRASLILALARIGGDLAGLGRDPVEAAAVAIGTAFDGAPDLAALRAAVALPWVDHLAFAHGRLGEIAARVLARIATPPSRPREPRATPPSVGPTFRVVAARSRPDA
jgi:hypothetical protein